MGKMIHAGIEVPLGSDGHSSGDTQSLFPAMKFVAALEALRTIREAGLDLPFHLEAIDFTDEESQWGDYLGNRALAEDLTREDLDSPPGGRDQLADGLARAGLTRQGTLSSRRLPSTLAGYLELHVEQGPRLAQAWIPIGVVTGIVGIRSFCLTFGGRADHAGTTPMDSRRDAGLGASAFLQSLPRLVLERSPGCVANVGKMNFNPGSLNVVPGRVEVHLEFRSLDDGQADDLWKRP